MLELCSRKIVVWLGFRRLVPVGVPKGCKTHLALGVGLIEKLFLGNESPHEVLYTETKLQEEDP